MRWNALFVFGAALPLVAIASCQSTSAVTTSSQSQDAGPSLPLAPGGPGVWPKFRNDAFQDGVSSVHAQKTGGALWSFQTGKGVFSSPVVAVDGTVYVGSADENFYALNAVTGRSRWQIACEGIIDSAALLDDEGRLYFGAGDGMLPLGRREDRRGRVDDGRGRPFGERRVHQLVRGERRHRPRRDAVRPERQLLRVRGGSRDGNAGMAVQDARPDLVAPRGRYAEWRDLYIGNNDWCRSSGRTPYSISPDGAQNWSDSSTPGTIAASPDAHLGWHVVVGAFDGYVHAYDEQGNAVWTFAARDHIYSSAAILPDGTIIAALRRRHASTTSIRRPGARSGVRHPRADPVFARRRWRRQHLLRRRRRDLYVLNPTGRSAGRSCSSTPIGTNLNSSPALGARTRSTSAARADEIFSVPYDYCLRAEGGSDPRCSTTAPTFPEGASLLWTTTFGALETSPPTAIDPMTPITLSLVDRTATGATLAILDSTNVTATVTPATPLDIVVSGDAKVRDARPPDAVYPRPRRDRRHQRDGPVPGEHAALGLKLSGGTPGGTAQLSFNATVNPAGTAPLSVASTWTVTRLSVPLPTVMPSYNQIGFDSLVYILGLAEIDGTSAVGWMVGGVSDAQGNDSVDPATEAILPLSVAIDGAILTFNAPGGITVEVTEINIPFTTFRMNFQLGTQGQGPTGTAALFGGTTCSEIPTYGTFLEGLGLCNPTTDEILVRGGGEHRLLRHTDDAARTGDRRVLGGIDRRDRDAHGVIAPAESAPCVDPPGQPDDEHTGAARVRARHRADGCGRRDDRAGDDPLRRERASGEREGVPDDRYRDGGERYDRVAVRPAARGFAPSS